MLRHYRRGGLVARFIDDHYVWLGAERTRAFREWRLLRKLRAAGLPVPNPVAAHVYRTGVIYTADIITAYLPDTRKLSWFIAQGRAPADCWRRIGAMIRAVHDHGVDHPDLTAHNVLLDDAGNTFLVDFDNAQLKPPGAWQRAGHGTVQPLAAQSRARNRHGVRRRRMGGASKPATQARSVLAPLLAQQIADLGEQLLLGRRRRAAAGGGAASCFRFSLFRPRMTRKIANATITKSSTVLMKMPYLMIGAPAASASATLAKVEPIVRFTNKLLKSTLPISNPIGGMMTSLTSDVTILPNAAPMMMPTAMSMTLPRIANSLNSFSIVVSPLRRLTVAPCSALGG